MIKDRLRRALEYTDSADQSLAYAMKYRGALPDEFDRRPAESWQTRWYRLCGRRPTHINKRGYK